MIILLDSFLVVAAATALIWLLIARPWSDARPADGVGTWSDRLRIAAAVTRYDFWLDVRGIGRRRRRDLREELRANLVEASARVGCRPAVDALGSLRQMATAATPTEPDGPRWSTGAIAAAWVFTVGIFVELMAIAAWFDGADASGSRRVEGGLTLFPGSAATLDHTGGGYAVSVEPGWLVIAAAVMIFLVVSRPWRALVRTPSTHV